MIYAIPLHQILFYFFKIHQILSSKEKGQNIWGSWNFHQSIVLRLRGTLPIYRKISLSLSLPPLYKQCHGLINQIQLKVRKQSKRKKKLSPRKARRPWLRPPFNTVSSRATSSSQLPSPRGGHSHPNCSHADLPWKKDQTRRGMTMKSSLYIFCSNIYIYIFCCKLDCCLMI